MNARQFGSGPLIQSGIEFEIYRGHNISLVFRVTGLGRIHSSFLSAELLFSDEP